MVAMRMRLLSRLSYTVILVAEARSYAVAHPSDHISTITDHVTSATPSMAGRASMAAPSARLRPAR